MIALTSETAAVVALRAAEGSWLMFLQAEYPGAGAGPIMIQGLQGKQLAPRLQMIAKLSPCDVQLVGLVTSQLPDEDAHALANEFSAYQLHDWWFEPCPELVQLITTTAQETLRILLAQTQPGGLSDAPVDAERMAAILDISVPTLRRMVTANEIPYLRVGRFHRFVPRDVIASLKQRS